MHRRSRAERLRDKLLVARPTYESSVYENGLPDGTADGNVLAKAPRLFEGLRFLVISWPASRSARTPSCFILQSGAWDGVAA